MRKKAFLTLAAIFFALVTYCQENNPSDEKGKVVARYDKNGLNIESTDGFFSLQPELRFQFRFYSSFDSNPRSADGFHADKRPSIIIRRARLKAKGHVGKEFIKYDFEYELAASRLLNANLKFEKWRGFSARIGQYKVPYNRERDISSGKQTLIERSIVNRAFTIDRQVGITIYGNFGAESIANFDYIAAVYTGTGLLSLANDDSNMMYMGRFQWNFIGEPIPTSESDSDRKGNEAPRGSIALAGATNISPYTRFSSGGGGLLDAFLRGEPGQYKVDQVVQDFMFKYKGISVLQELHYKKINDRIDNVDRNMRGYFVQVGFFPGYVIDGITKNLQFAFRIANNDENISEDEEQYRDELTFGVNYYFNGFRNRLQTDFSLLDLHTPDEIHSTQRFRIQWDISF